MHPYLFSVGDFTVGTFGLCMVAGFIVAWVLLRSEIKRRGLKKSIDVDMLLGAMIGGIVGAKGWYIVEHWDKFVGDPGAYIFTGGGLVWYGGLLFGFLGSVIALVIHKQKIGPYADAIAPSLAIGLAIGRVGWLLSGDGDYGPSSDLPWAMAFPNGTVPTPDRVHPTMVYESIAFVLVFVILWTIRKKDNASGWLFLVYLILAGVVRFIMEFWRNTPEVLGFLTMAQLFSISMIILGTVWLVIILKSVKRNPE